MFKYIKWIGLLIILFLILVLGMKFVNYINLDNVADFSENNMNEFNIIDIYNIPLYKTGIAYYQGDKLISKNFEIVDNCNITFYENYFEFIDPYSDVKDKFIYTYENGVINVNSDNYFLVKGMYDVSYENSKIKLSQTEDGNTFVYYFDTLKNN